MFAGIAKLPPAHVLVGAHPGVTLRSYWRPAPAAARPSRLDGAATVRTVLLRAVERELMSDVPVGVFTSGGLDSSFLAAAAARVKAGEQIHTYSVRFTEPGYDESPHAEAVTHHIRTIPHLVTAGDAPPQRPVRGGTGPPPRPRGGPPVPPTE